MPHKLPLLESLTELINGPFPAGSKRRFIYTDAKDALDLIEAKRAAIDLESLGRVKLTIGQNSFEVEKLAVTDENPDDEIYSERTMTEGLPVAGYVPQTDWNLSLVNANKRAEESILRLLDKLGEIEHIDKYWLAIGRTDIEKGFMAVNRAVFKPERVKLD